MRGAVCGHAVRRRGVPPLYGRPGGPGQSNELVPQSAGSSF